MFDCPNCGRPVIRGAVFCLDCGAGLDSGRAVRDRDIKSWEISGPGPFLMVVDGIDRGRSFTLSRSIVSSIGRRPVEVALRDPYVSRRHAEIEITGKVTSLRDTASANKTYVNSKEIKTYTLCDGDIIQVGNTTLVFHENI